MNYFQSLVLSVVEGITEFLPVSSTGHLILASALLKIEQTDFIKSFEIAIQLGAILSVVFLYKEKFLHISKIWKVLLAGFIPTAFVGLVLYKFIKNYLLGSSEIVSVSLIVGGVVLIAYELIYKSKGNKTDKIENIGLKNALIIGIFQSVSVIPGVSRAAATVIGGLLLGLDRRTAVEFSFLLAVPTMLAATGLDMFENLSSFTGTNVGLILVGFIGAFITAAFTIKLFVSYIKKRNFIPFGIYRIIIGLIFLK